MWLIEQGVASPEDIDATVRLSFGFRYAAAGPIVQKEHSGWDTTCAVAKIIWPDLTNADWPAADPADATSTRAASASRPSAASSNGTTSPSQKSVPDTSTLFASV